VPTKRKKRRTQARRREEMRRRLLDAAIALLIERGYSGFRVAEVANLARRDHQEQSAGAGRQRDFDHRGCYAGRLRRAGISS
jgi:hypothetical protein